MRSEKNANHAATRRQGFSLAVLMIINPRTTQPQRAPTDTSAEIRKNDISHQLLGEGPPRKLEPLASCNADPTSALG